MPHGNQDSCPECRLDRLVFDPDQKVHVCCNCYVAFDDGLRRLEESPQGTIPEPCLRRPPSADECDEEILDSGIVCRHDNLVTTREGDAVCSLCGSVLYSGVDLFHVAGLVGAAYLWRKGTYKIKYYYNEKLAQWSRECPPPSDDTFSKFLAEARNSERNGDPARFTRKDIARICRRIGKPTMQEKWILLMDMCKRKDPVYFKDLNIPPKPSVRLRNEMKRLFLISLPAWEMCKDEDVSEELKKLFPEMGIPGHFATKKKRKRKSYPHNYMMRRSLRQIQEWYPDDEDLGRCYDLHEKSIKKVSRSIELWQDMIYKYMCEIMNGGGVG
jgi:hypothetical protein